MQRRDFLAVSLLAPLALIGRTPVALAGGGQASRPVAPDGRPHAFGFDRRRFQLDGREFRIHSGEVHPARIAREQWRHRIRMARAMGLNTVALYVMWNHHEREPGVFDFESGNRDIVGFIRLCQAEGMWVYLRPGPYVCAEWTNGGIPAWLLRDPDTRLRDRDDPRYMAAVRRYIAALAPLIAPLMSIRGGPVLMLQVENEYSMFAADVGYLEAIEAAWREHGIAGPFSVSDGWKDLVRRRAYLPGATLGLDGADVATLVKGKAFAGEAPVWVGEGYPGWLTHWGEPAFAAKDYVETLRRVMKAGYSFNLYVVHGGTNFGLTAGANAEDDGSQFQPAITSYDYGAPIDERGRATPQFGRLRKVIADATGVTPPPLPEPEPVTTFSALTLTPHASLWDNLYGDAARVPVPGPNETLFGQDQGLVVYRKRIDAGTRLRLEGVRDYAVVYSDGRELAHISRVEHASLSSSPDVALAGGGTLDVLVDTFGHINFGPRLGDHKGLIGPVTLDDAPLRDFEAWALPLDGEWLQRLAPLTSVPTRGGVFFEGKLRLERPGDVYIDMGEWTKGYLWINGQLLGRYWHIGPQRRLFCPGPWLRAGDNTVMVLDLHRSIGAAIHAAERLHDGGGDASPRD
jgi:beta-galactosidase